MLAAPEYNIRHFQPSKGSLSSVNVKHILQDRRGFMWFGTDSGLDRFDGYELTHVIMPEDCKGYDDVRSLCEDDSGRLWVGSFEGICVYDPTSGKVSRYSKGSVADMVKTRDGSIWVAGNYAGFLHIDPSTGQCDTLKYSYHNASAHFGSGLCYDGKDKVYFVNGVGAIYSVSSLDERELTLDVPWDVSPFSMLHISSFHYFDGMIYGSAPRKAIFYDTRTGSYSEKPLSMSCALQQIGDILLMASSDGIYVLDGDFNPAGRLVDDAPMKDKGIAAMLVDGNGVVWIGTLRSGLYCLSRNIAEIESIPLGGRPVCIAEDPSGKLWVNTKYQGLKTYDPATGAVADVALPLDSGEMLAVGIIGDEVMVGTNSTNEHLAAVNWKNGRVRVLPYAPATAYSYFPLPGGRFIEGASGRPVIVDQTAGKAIRTEKVRTTANSILSSPDSTIWYATVSTGLWSQKDLVWTHYTSESDGVSMQLNGMTIDRDGIIWLATRNNGVQRFDPRSREVTDFHIFDNTSCRRSANVVADPDGIIWASTQKGLASIDSKTFGTSLYTVDDGLVFGEAGLSAVYVSKAGILYSGNDDGLLALNPRNLRAVSYGGEKIVITGFSRLNAVDSPYFEQSAVPVAVPPGSALKLKARDNSFRINVSDMDYRFPKQHRIIYNLEGYDDKWHDVNDGLILINNLPSGEYMLHVKLTDRSGRITGCGIETPVFVRNPLLLSVIARIMYVLLAGGLIALIIRQTRNRATTMAEENAKLEWEKKEAEAQRQLYMSKVQFLINVAHEIRTPLALVRAPIESMRDKLSRTADVALKEDIEIVSRNSEKLSDFLEELLDLKKFDLPADDSSKAMDVTVKDIVKEIPEFDIPHQAPTVLVADDNDDMRNFLTHNLETAYHVIAVENGREALEVLENSRNNVPSIVISDVMMPEMNGYALCSEIRKNPAINHIPVILLTARGDKTSRVLGMEYGADAYISKPFALDELHGAIKRLLVNREFVKVHFAGQAATAEKQDVQDDNKFLLSIDNHIKQHLSDPDLNVESLAAFACMSESNLYKRLKRLIGSGPGEYIMLMRLKKAAQLLKDTDMSISEISVKVGFNSLTYFSSSFKNRFGVTPKAYRGSRVLNIK